MILCMSGEQSRTEQKIVRWSGELHAYINAKAGVYGI